MTDGRTDRQTYRNDEANSRFRNFTKVQKIQKQIIRDGCRSGFERPQVQKNNVIGKEFAHIGTVSLLYVPQPHVVETSCLVRHLPTRIPNAQLVLGKSPLLSFLLTKCDRFSFVSNTSYSDFLEVYRGLPWKLRGFSALKMLQSCLFIQGVPGGMCQTSGDCSLS